MRKDCKSFYTVLFTVLFFFGLAIAMETAAWARAGGGRSFGSRGSRSYTAPRTPSSPSQTSPGMSTPGRSSIPSQNPAQPSGGFFSRSPFLQGMAGGLAGGLLGSMLFGGSGHASPMGGSGGGGMGFLDILILGLLLYFGWKFLKRRRAQTAGADYYSSARPSDVGGPSQMGYQRESINEPVPQAYGSHAPYEEVDRGMQQIRQFDPGFDEEAFKDTVQDLFFRIQAGWMNRTVQGIENLLTPEMAELFRGEFQAMKQRGIVNRLENIAVRKVEPVEVWQETGKDYITVLFTANLLDYTIDDQSGQVVEGDKLNPVKFQEFWTFCRDIGSSQWRLSAINQMEESAERYN